MTPTATPARGSFSRRAVAKERKRRESGEYRLEIAMQKLGESVLEGKLTIPPQRLGHDITR